MSYDGMKVRQLRGGRSTLVEEDADVEDDRAIDRAMYGAPTTGELVADYHSRVKAIAANDPTKGPDVEYTRDLKAFDAMAKLYGFKRTTQALEQVSAKAKSMKAAYGKGW